MILFVAAVVSFLSSFFFIFQFPKLIGNLALTMNSIFLSFTFLFIFCCNLRSVNAFLVAISYRFKSQLSKHRIESKLNTLIFLQAITCISFSFFTCCFFFVWNIVKWKMSFKMIENHINNKILSAIGNDGTDFILLNFFLNKKKETWVNNWHRIYFSFCKCYNI